MVSLPFGLVLSTVRAVAHDPRVYGYSFDRYNVAQVTGLSRTELDRAAARIIEYFSSSEDWLTIQVVKDGKLVPLFNTREILHMRDVKDLFNRVYRLQLAALIYSIAYVGLVVVWARERSPRQLARDMLSIGLAMGALVIVAGVGILFGFDRLFEEFHLLSFSNDYWQLDPANDRLVQMFPEGFWFDVTAFIGVVTLIEAGVIVGLSSLYLRQNLAPSTAPKAAPSEATPSRA
jgi:integral membrane protein (TIGR01906 family)